MPTIRVTGPPSSGSNASGEAAERSLAGLDLLRKIQPYFEERTTSSFTAREGIDVQSVLIHLEPIPRPGASLFSNFLSSRFGAQAGDRLAAGTVKCRDGIFADRKSTRLNSSHVSISYAVF